MSAYVENSIAKCNEEEELKSLIETLKREQQNYLKRTIIRDLIEDVINDGSINDEFKIKDLKTSICLRQANVFSLLNIPEKQSHDLSHAELNSFKGKLKEKLSEKNTELIASHPNWTVTFENFSRLDTDSKEALITDQFKKLQNEQQRHFDLLHKYHSLLEEIVEVRLKNLPEKTHAISEEMELRLSMINIKKKIMEKKLKLDMFTETDFSLEAYSSFIEDLKEQIQTCQENIEELSKLKSKYDQVSSKEYKDILQKYKDYKSSIETKTKLNQHFNQLTIP